MSAKINQQKYPIIVVNAKRTERKTYMTQPSLKEAIAKANKFGCPGNIMLHDEDGSELCDNEIFEYLLERKAKFMVCYDYSDWRKKNISEISIQKVRKTLSQSHTSRLRSNHCSSEREPHSSSTSEQNNLPEQVPDIVGVVSYPQFANYSIPWEKVPLDIMKLLEEEEPLLRNMHTLAIFFVSELLNVHETIPIPIMRKVAELTVSRYSNSFLGINMAKNVSDAIDLFFNRMKHRYFNIRRGIIKSKTFDITRKSTDNERKEMNVEDDCDIYVIDIDVKEEFDNC